MKDKRNHTRVDKKIKSEIHTPDGMTYSTSLDISNGGIFISTPEPIAEGSDVELSLQIPGGKEINVKGIVRWRREEGDKAKRAGMGIEFIGATESEIEKLKKAIGS